MIDEPVDDPFIYGGGTVVAHDSAGTPWRLDGVRLHSIKTGFNIEPPTRWQRLQYRVRSNWLFRLIAPRFAKPAIKSAPLPQMPIRWSATVRSGTFKVKAIDDNWAALVFDWIEGENRRARYRQLGSGYKVAGWLITIWLLWRSFREALR